MPRRGETKSRVCPLTYLPTNRYLLCLIQSVNRNVYSTPSISLPCSHTSLVSAYLPTFLILALLVYSFIHSFIQAISIAPLQAHYYSEVLPIQHGYCVRVSHRNATGNCERRTCPRSLCGG